MTVDDLVLDLHAIEFNFKYDREDKKIAKKLKNKSRRKLKSYEHKHIRFRRYDKDKKNETITKFKLPTRKCWGLDYTQLKKDLKNCIGKHFYEVEEILLEKYKNHKDLIRKELNSMWDWGYFNENGIYSNNRRLMIRYWYKNDDNDIEIDDGHEFYKNNIKDIIRKKPKPYKKRIKKNKSRINQKKLNETKLKLIYVR